MSEEGAKKEGAGDRGEHSTLSSAARSFLLTVRGTRALAVCGFLLLALAILEPALPGSMSRLWLVLPVVTLLVLGLLTLPVEGVVAQQRARALLQHPRPVKPMVQRLVWIALLCILLLPPLFLAAYGIPHLNPFTGLLLPTIQRRISLGFLYFVLLIPIFYLRSSRRYAPTIRRGDPEPRTRDGLLVMTYGLGVAWAILLEPFWRPFSLLVWPPDLSSLVAGVRGVAAIAFTLVIPLVLFMSLAAHLEMLRAIWKMGPKEWRARRPLVALAAVHIALILLAVVLHAYDLLWIVRYQAASSL